MNVKISQRVTCASAAALALVGLAACGGGTEQTAFDEWSQTTSPSGAYTVKLPGETEKVTQQVQGIELNLITSSDGEDQFGISETQLPKGTPFDLDGGVKSSAQQAFANYQKQVGEGGTSTESSLVTGTYQGMETREFAYDFEAGDHTARYSGMVFVDDGLVVQMIALDADIDNEQNKIDFMDSLQPAG